jgi:hypothetical protein
MFMSHGNTFLLISKPINRRFRQMSRATAFCSSTKCTYFQFQGRMRGQEDLLLKMEKQVRETQAGLIHLSSSNEAISSDLEALQRKSEARRLTEEQILKKLEENETQETTLQIEKAVARINETEMSVQLVFSSSAGI